MSHLQGFHIPQYKYGTYQRDRSSNLSGKGDGGGLITCVKGNILCCTMACFERDLHTLISDGDQIVLALYWSYL